VLIAPSWSGFGAKGVDELSGLTLAEAGDRVRKKEVSPVELTRACLGRIERLDPQVNAFITVTRAEALRQAQRAETEIRRGEWRGPLHGIPIGLKDNIDTAGIRTTAGSAVFIDRVPTDDADVVRRLKAAGAVIVGKLNLDEFAFGHSSTFSHFGPVHNPWKLDYIAGGSSGGSAAAVAARFCYGALGTDTGGSVRTPSAHCGVVGLRPTSSLGGLRGIVPLSPTFDRVGPIARRVGDVARMLSAIGESTSHDDASRIASNDAKHVAAKVKALRIGVVRTLVDEIEDAEIREAIRDAASVIRSLAAEVREVNLPPVAGAVFGDILLSEAYVFHRSLLERAADRYDPVIRSRAELGRNVSSTSYGEARRELERLHREVLRAFSDTDLLLAPTAYAPPDTIERSIRLQMADPTGKKGGDRPPRLPTVPFSVYGLPILSVPCGFTRSGLPIGLQIAGTPFAEGNVLTLADAYERATHWHERSPRVAPRH
jgi:aspartyl-tRNA(Asn)/glutamyl-tRNA(Gln) amidotransferase subunit A